MDAAYEARYAEVEERHPWFVARRRLFSGFVDDSRRLRILDFGCGTGRLLRDLRARGHASVEGVEPSENLRLLGDPELRLHAQLPEGGYDRIFMLDVLEHIADDRGTLATMRGHLEPGGRLLLSVPAHPFLWSRHDEQNHHERRYTKKELEEKLRAARFRILRVSYWNMFNFLPLAALRLLKIERHASELELGNQFVHALLHAVFRVENWLVRRIDLPMGVSLIAIAERDDSGCGAVTRES